MILQIHILTTELIYTHHLIEAANRRQDRGPLSNYLHGVFYRADQLLSFLL